MQNRDIIVIGASAGGITAIKQIVSCLPAGFPAAIFIVWHMSPGMPSLLPAVFERMGNLPVNLAEDGQTIQKGHIYIAVPDHHLIIQEDKMRVIKGPKENRFRPAIDPLFRSAAVNYGPRVIGIILSGALNDGAAGLWTIKQQGGMAIVQDPDDAEISSMPLQALLMVQVDDKLPAAEIGERLIEAVSEPVTKEETQAAKYNPLAEWETSVAMNASESERIFQFGELTPYTCPECQGVLSALYEGGHVRYRCHTGHAFTADTLLNNLTEKIEDLIWAAIRGSQESVMLLNHMGDHIAESNDSKMAGRYYRKAMEAEHKARLLQQVLEYQEQLSDEKIRGENIEIKTP